MVCDAKDVKGGGHFAIVYDSPEHYSGKMTMSMDSHGHHMATNTSFEAKWLSADCKAKGPGLPLMLRQAQHERMVKRESCPPPHPELVEGGGALQISGPH